MFTLQKTRGPSHPANWALHWATIHFMKVPFIQNSHTCKANYWLMINLWPLETQHFGYFVIDSNSEGKYSINSVKLHDTEKTFCWLKVKSCQKKKKNPSRKLSQTNLDCFNSGFLVTEPFPNNVETECGWQISCIHDHCAWKCLLEHISFVFSPALFHVQVTTHLYK